MTHDHHRTRGEEIGMSADLLRRAADRLDDLASDALSVRSRTRPWPALHGYGTLVVHPSVGKALAAWLRDEAETNAAVFREPFISQPGSAPWHMIAVARAILGQQAADDTDRSPSGVVRDAVEKDLGE